MRPSNKARLEALALSIKEEGQDAKVLDAPIVVTRDPHEQEYKTVEVEWLGEPSFTTSPYIMYKLALAGQSGGFTHHQAAVIRAAGRLRIGRFPKVTRRMGEESGLSRTYMWGSKTKSRTCFMTYKDADKLLSGSSAYEFRIVGQESPGKRELLLPENNIRIVADKEYKAIEEYVKDDRPASIPRPESFGIRK